MAILTQFVLRLSFGLAAGMALTSPRQVTSGYYRNHLYVLLGLNVLAALAALSSPEQLWFWPPLAAAVLAYLGSVLWLYERPRPGLLILVLIAGIDLLAAWVSWVSGGVMAAGGELAWSPLVRSGEAILVWLNVPTGGLVLGLTMAAMFLGHWYLNSPTMELAPLRRLLHLLVAALLVRAAVCGVGAAAQWAFVGALSTSTEWFLLLRWLSGIAATLGLVWMALRTLDIPNTQSATGILYVAVITTFTGELCGELLSRGARFPL